MNRTCDTCNIEKPLIREFFRSLYTYDKKGNERFRKKCKECYKLTPTCQSKYQKEYYKKNKQRLNAYRAEYYRQNQRQKEENNNIES